MIHENRNMLLAFYNGELSTRQYQKTAEHIKTCPSCRKSLNALREVEVHLQVWPDESPLPDTFSTILAGLPSENPSLIRKTAPVPARAIFEIALAVFALLGLILLLRSRLELLPLWEPLQEFWLVQAIGSFGVALLLITIVGSFVSLAMAPILYFRTHAGIVAGHMSFKSQKS